jgi:hypothetical protein
MNNKIEPCYCSFEQCKLLKEKGFDVMPHYIKNKTDYILGYNFDLEDKYDYLKKREFQFEDHVCSHLYLMPEQWQVIEFFRLNYGIWIKVDHFITNENSIDWDFEIDKTNTDVDERGNYIPIVSFDVKRSFNTPQKAYSAAFDYILTNLI